jgi:hypothetical protein
VSYTNLRDFYPEYSTVIDGWIIEIEKLGGGTIGKSYDGHWRYIVTDAFGEEITRGQDLYTGAPATHDEAALILWGFLDADSDE